MIFDILPTLDKSKFRYLKEAMEDEIWFYFSETREWWVDMDNMNRKHLSNSINKYKREVWMIRENEGKSPSSWYVKERLEYMEYKIPWMEHYLSSKPTE